MREAGVDQLLKQLGIAGEGAGACPANHSMLRYAGKQKQKKEQGMVLISAGQRERCA